MGMNYPTRPKTECAFKAGIKIKAGSEFAVWKRLQ